MMEVLGNSVECIICMEVMEGEIKQCNLGHSICGNCAKAVEICPLCKSNITPTRNYKLEDVMTKLKDMTVNYNVTKKRTRKERNIKAREINSNRPPVNFELDKWNTMSINENIKDSFEVLIISKHHQLFWYKKNVNARKMEVSWMFQYTEPKSPPIKYYYELTISESAVKTIEMSETCESENRNPETLINSGKCITIPFKILKNFLRADNKIYFKFNIIAEMDLTCRKVARPLNFFPTIPDIPLQYRAAGFDYVSFILNELKGFKPNDLIPSVTGENEILDLSTNETSDTEQNSIPTTSNKRRKNKMVKPVVSREVAFAYMVKRFEIALQVHRLQQLEKRTSFNENPPKRRKYNDDSENEDVNVVD